MGGPVKSLILIRTQVERKMCEILRSYYLRGPPHQQFYSGPGQVWAWFYFEGVKAIKESQLLKGQSENF
jgi:hypothetical protein